MGQSVAQYAQEYRRLDTQANQILQKARQKNVSVDNDPQLEKEMFRVADQLEALQKRVQNDVRSTRNMIKNGVKMIERQALTGSPKKVEELARLVAGQAYDLDELKELDLDLDNLFSNKIA